MFYKKCSSHKDISHIVRALLAATGMKGLIIGPFSGNCRHKKEKELLTRCLNSATMQQNSSKVKRSSLECFMFCIWAGSRVSLVTDL